MQVFFLSILEHGKVLNVDMSQGGVETCLSVVGYLMMTLLQIYY